MLTQIHTSVLKKGDHLLVQGTTEQDSSFRMFRSRLSPYLIVKAGVECETWATAFKIVYAYLQKKTRNMEQTLYKAITGGQVSAEFMGEKSNMWQLVALHVLL